jgi:WhiB family redox-sensing transcriptional regulator
MSERESAQRERGATTAVRLEGREPVCGEERALSERESAQRERGASEHDGPRREPEAQGTVLLGLFGLAEEQTWQERALCAQTDPEAFFPEKGGSTREAKRICSTCEVRSECLEYALEHDERFGIWGGLSERERRRVKRHAV